MMDLRTAVEVFKRFEECKEVEHEGDPPTYEVRLDASMVRETDERGYRLRVNATIWGEGRDALLYVLEVAAEFDLYVELQNSAFELR